MKKVLLSLVAILIISVGSAKAQTVWGIRAGMGAPIVTSDSESLSGKFGFEIGPTAYFSLNNKLYLNAAALFSMKTFEYISLSYLEVPAYLGYRVPLGKIETYLQAGPYVGYKISESIDSNIGYEGGTVANDFDAGIAVMYGVNINRFKIEIGAKYGLTDVSGYGEKLITPFLGVSYIF
ncbi:hypothetical protein AGMMS50239_05250 [Bacteroidia bacterium]|nr:hypothetical protein AGMMS50239_05250 [Bacteroidia bacterium]